MLKRRQMPLRRQMQPQRMLTTAPLKPLTPLLQPQTQRRPLQNIGLKNARVMRNQLTLH